MIGMDSFKEPNAQASSFSSNGGDNMNRSSCHDEEETDSSLPLTAHENLNGHQHADAQHQTSNNGIEDSDISNGSLDRILNKVSASFVMEPSSARFKPVRKHHHHPPPPNAIPQSQEQQNHGLMKIKRSKSDFSNPPYVTKRCDSINKRRQSDINGLRSPANVTMNRHPNGHHQQHENNRESFELKQSAIYSMQTDGTLEKISAMERLKVEEAWNNQQNFWARLAMRASDPDTSHKELIKRSTFLVISVMTVAAGVLWGLMYVALREWVAALMPFIYSTSMSLILFTCICRNYGTSGYDTFAECQLTLILVLPFAVHVALGGVERSGGVMLWSFLCPMGAAFFRNAKECLRWFWIYMSINGVLLIKEFWDVGDDDDHSVSVAAVENEEGVTSIGSTSSSTIQKLYFLMNIIGVKCVIFAAVFLFARELEKEYTKSEEVLLNILPSSIVKRVKRGEFPIVDHVAGVTILFADLVGFTKASAELHPNFLIGLFLRDIFHEFDELVYQHGLEKIKTIGDAYMIVGGLNHGEKLSQQSQSQSAKYKHQKPHATNIMLMALDMRKALDRINQKYNLSFELRIGIHTGPIVAGVLGLKRFTYDVWGDAVNTASRMESNGVPSLIHLSSEMHKCVEGMTDVFDFSCCGKINVKGKGEMTTYLAKPRQ